MKINHIHFLSDNIDGVKKFPNCQLGDIVVLAGRNGSGKTRLIKAIIKHIRNLSSNIKSSQMILKVGKDDVELSSDIAAKIKIVNYSHYDAILQVPENFPPYVIHKARENLENCNYEETALNSLLWIYDIARLSSEKENDSFEEFAQLVKDKFNIDISVDKSIIPIKVSFFGEDINNLNLSPGQQYLLRMAVACYLHSDDENTIVFLDEPELHLHPEALINVVDYLLSVFNQSQFWISTHSLPLIAHLSATKNSTTILNMINGEISILRSNSESLITGLMGSEDNRIFAQQFLSTPFEYACSTFAIECYEEPDTCSASANDPQNNMIILKEGDTVVDFGTGKGRFIEGLGIDRPELVSKVNIFAFDPDKKDSEKCLSVMENLSIPKNHYTNSFENLLINVNSAADYVILVNVLHEINPKKWVEIFNNIKKLLKKTGKLIIVEREELTVGEMPYEYGFLMIVESAANFLFSNCCNCERYEKKDFKSQKTIKKPIVKYTIPFEGLNHIDKNAIKKCIEIIKDVSLKKIEELRKEKSDKYKLGLQTSFWLHQYANASLVIEKEFSKES